MVDMFWKDTCNVVTWNGAHLCKHHKTIVVKSSYIYVKCDTVVHNELVIIS